jgi:hypothetical protein
MTNDFNHITVLISIIVALGLAEIFNSWRSLFQHRSPVKYYFPHGLWSLFMVAMIIQHWWGIRAFQSVSPWTFFGMAALVVQNLLVVSTALILSPRIDAGVDIDLKAHFQRSRFNFYTVGGLLFVVLVLVEHLLLGQPLGAVENVIRYGGLGICAVGVATAKQEGDRIDMLLSCAAVLLLVAFVLIGKL